MEFISCLTVCFPASFCEYIDIVKNVVSVHLNWIEQIYIAVIRLNNWVTALIIEKLLQRKSSGSDLESREYGRKDPSSWSRGTLYPQTLALTSLTSGGRSAGIVLSRTQATESH
jgi:hypothetical protein